MAQFYENKTPPRLILVNEMPAEIELLTRRVEALGARAVVARHWAEGGAGAEDLARAVLQACEQTNHFRFVYDEALPLWQKVEAIATKIYGAASVTASAPVQERIERLQAAGYGHFPVCIAKTQMSFSTHARLRGAPSGHVLDIREVRLAAGAEFVVMVCGDIMTMPGLPKVPSAETIDLDAQGRVVGLF